MHRYRCPLCGITSTPYVTRAAADRHGAVHRDKRHGGDHPDGEHIVQAAAEVRALEGGEWVAVLVVLVLIAAGLLSKLG